MDCTQARNLLSEYQDGTLDATVAAALDAHLRGCGECAGSEGSLLAVRELLRELPPDPAPPELLARVLAAVEAENRDAARIPSAEGRMRRSRFYPVSGSPWRRPRSSCCSPPSTGTSGALRPPSAPHPASLPTFPPKPPRLLPPDRRRREDVVKDSPPGIRSPGVKPKAPGKAAPSAAKPRTWTEADLPSVPAIRASTDSERIVPVAPSARTDGRSGGGGSPGVRGEAEYPTGKEARSPARRVSSQRRRPALSAPCRTDGTSSWT